MNNRGLIFTLIGLSAAALLSVGLAYMGVSGRLLDTSPPLVYSNDRFYAVDDSLCSGEPLKFVITSTIQKAPVRVSTYYSVWDSKARRTVRSDSGPQNNLIFLPNDIGRTISSTVTFSDTTGLPKGSYEFRRFAQALGREPQVYSVTFQVVDCP